MMEETGVQIWSQVLIAGVGIISTIVSAVVSWILARRKYNSEVDGNVIHNMQESLDFYIKLSDDNKARLDLALQKNADLEKEMGELKTQMINLVTNICYDLQCQYRLRNKVITRDEAEGGKNIQGA